MLTNQQHISDESSIDRDVAYTLKIDYYRSILPESS